jgi:hypothetical protein
MRGRRTGSPAIRKKAQLCLRGRGKLGLRSDDERLIKSEPWHATRQTISFRVKKSPDGNIGAEVLPKLIGRAVPTLRTSRVQRKAQGNRRVSCAYPDSPLPKSFFKRIRPCFIPSPSARLLPLNSCGEQTGVAACLFSAFIISSSVWLQRPCM